MSDDKANYFGAHPHIPGYDSQREKRDARETQVGSGRADTGNVVQLFDAQPDPGSTARFQAILEKEGLPQLQDSYTRATVLRGAWVEVDLDAIIHNLHITRKRVGYGRKIMAVVKADGYGHGAVPVAKVALENGADCLAVSSVEEGVILRQAGIEAEIIILSQPPQRSIPYILAYDLTTTVTTSDFALALGEKADLQGRVARYHLAVDTGMNRIGVQHDEVVDFLRSIGFHRGLELSGVFTHFATADSNDEYDFRIQQRRFNTMLQQLADARIDPGTVHAANSAAIMRYPEVYYDMVRVGVTMYGLAPSTELRGVDDLRPAMSIKGQVTFVKEPGIGEGVSYGMHYRVAKPVTVATVPIGYADGLNRALSGRMKVLINGRLCNQIGSICMDQLMVEIPAARPRQAYRYRDVQVGDEVVFIGRQGDYEITADTMADELGTINYEICCVFGLRLPKIYIGGRR